ncbi:MAG: lytic transglycosylase domain-containing protein [Magnetospirillum sp.]|nr:lytic transglycosylase domain-containing protein [Magnetospirillum sp.]
MTKRMFGLAVAVIGFGLLAGEAGAAVPAGPAVGRDDVQRMVVEEAARAGVDPELALAVAKVESGFNPAAVSSAGARGVMQIMPATARSEFGVGPELLFDARLNVRMGVAYLKTLIDFYGREEFALSHYNGGSRVGPPPYSKVIPATREYVDAVLSWKRRYETEGGAQVILAGLGTIAVRQPAPRVAAATTARVATTWSDAAPLPAVRRLPPRIDGPEVIAVDGTGSTGRWVAVANAERW